VERPIWFENEGQTIRGMLHAPRPGPAPCVVFCHGFTGNRIEAHCIFVKCARALCEAGMAALRFDFRGSGESDGRFEDMTVPGEIRDALAALEFARAQPEVDALRVGLLGLSLGGCVAACAAARDGQVSALCLWAATSDPAVFKAMGETELFRRNGRLDLEGNVIGRAFVDTCDSVDPLAEVERFRGQALIIHGSQDETVMPDHAERYRRALTNARQVEVHIVEGAGHVFSSEKWESEVIQRTVGFFAQAF
jgi:pimeloyl-ACP methyl ester carboxylesterase